MPFDQLASPRLPQSVSDIARFVRQSLAFVRLHIETDRNDRAVLRLLEQRFQNIQPKGVLSLQDWSDTRARLIDHIVATTDTAAIMVADIAKVDAAIAVKLLWLTLDGSVVVRTLARNSESRERREGQQPPNFFSFRNNSAFTEILTRPPHHGYYACDNLSALHAAGRYQNSNSRWPYEYNSTAVVGIEARRSPLKPIVGFVCADARYGRLSSSRVRRALEMLASHLFDVFEWGCALERSFTLSRKSLGEVAGCTIGWSRAGVPDVLNAGDQKFFQSMIEDAEHDYRRHIEKQAAQVRLRKQLVGADSYVGAQDETTMPSIYDFVADDLADEIDRALKEAPKASDEEFLAILEKIAPGNPYAEQLLRAARKKGLGLTH